MCIRDSANAVFAGTWGERVGPPPEQEYWREVLSAVRAAQPAVRFVAEVYWDMEWELQQQGFDFCYDKRLYDRLAYETVESVRGHLMADLAYQEPVSYTHLDVYKRQSSMRSTPGSGCAS